MDIKATIATFYYRMILNELRRMNASQFLPGLTHNSLLYLDLIDMTPDCTVSTLADLLGVTRSAVTIKVRELVAAGLVDKRQCRHDKRQYHLKVRNEVAREYRVYDRSFLDALRAVEKRHDRKEITAFCRVLDTLTNSLTGDAANA